MEKIRNRAGSSESEVEASKREEMKKSIVSEVAQRLADEEVSKLDPEVLRGRDDNDYFQAMVKRKRKFEVGLGYLFDQYADMILSADDPAGAFESFYKQQKQLQKKLEDGAA